MPQDRALATRGAIVAAASDLIRQNGYTATTVDHICARAKVTKGAFFHHFRTKDEAVQAALAQWNQGAAAMEATAPFQSAKSPRARALGYMDLYISVFDNPAQLKSCLAGTTVQEVADSNEPLRDAANMCFTGAHARFQTLLDDACRGSRKRIDTAGLASLWMAAVQGSLILFKASQDASLIRRNLEHVRTYIASQLPKGVKRS
jgi:TetR/AcrR family transcriptional regulator, transcriptional repressor for nem operon